MDPSCSPAVFIVVLLTVVNLDEFFVSGKKAVQVCETAVWWTVPAASTTRLTNGYQTGFHTQNAQQHAVPCYRT